MKKIPKIFFDASLAELKQGYRDDADKEEYVCVLCGERFVKGRIYPLGDILVDAEKAVKIHINQVHSSTFAFLLELDKKYTGLTERQKNILTCFYRNLSDKEIALKMENGNTSTIRNQRFSFREKAKQAKIYLAMIELLEEHGSKAEKLIEIPPGVSMADDRFLITEEENAKIIKAYFKKGSDGPLDSFPTKEKRKIVILKQLMNRFDSERRYTEPEINEILKSAYDDYVTLRRYLIEYGFLDRLPDGSAYWVKKQSRNNCAEENGIFEEERD